MAQCATKHFWTGWRKLWKGLQYSVNQNLHELQAMVTHSRHGARLRHRILWEVHAGHNLFSAVAESLNMEAKVLGHQTGGKATGLHQIQGS